MNPNISRLFKWLFIAAFIIILFVGGVAILMAAIKVFMK